MTDLVILKKNIMLPLNNPKHRYLDEVYKSWLETTNNSLWPIVEYLKGKVIPLKERVYILLKGYNIEGYVKYMLLNDIVNYGFKIYNESGSDTERLQISKILKLLITDPRVLIPGSYTEQKIVYLFAQTYASNYYNNNLLISHIITHDKLTYKNLKDFFPPYDVSSVGKINDIKTLICSLRASLFKHIYDEGSYHYSKDILYESHLSHIKEFLDKRLIGFKFNERTLQIGDKAFSEDKGYKKIQYYKNLYLEVQSFENLLIAFDKIKGDIQGRISKIDPALLSLS